MCKSVHHHTDVPIATEHSISLLNKNNEDIATKFEQQYVRCVRNEEECVCSVCLFRCNILIGVRIIKEMPGSLTSGIPCIINTLAYQASPLVIPGNAGYPS